MVASLPQPETASHRLCAHGTELYLVYACSLGECWAVAACEGLCVPQLTKHLSRLGLPDVAYLKARYAQELNAASARVRDGLGAEERTLLRQYVIDRLTIDELALLYGVHRATVARRLARSQSHVLTQAQDLLTRALD